MLPEVEGLTGLVEVGRGGFGTVYRAHDEKLGRDVAVKVIRDSGLGDNIVARFERECKALGALSGHPNIVAVHGSGQTERGDLYIVMEYLAGGSLAQRVTASGPAGFEDVAAWGTALAGALETAHRSGIVHRDVKPDNVLFSEYGTPKLVDFGIARMRSAYETRSGFFSATLNHAAPEVVAGASISPSADLYSLASVLFYALVGRAAFERGGEDSLAPLIARITTATPPDLREYGVPDALAGVIENGLSKDPAGRFESAEKFGEALRRAGVGSGANVSPVPIGDREWVAQAAAVVGEDVGRTPVETAQVGRRRVMADAVAKPPEPARRSRRPLLIALAGVLALALGVAGVAFVLSDGPTASDTTTGTPDDDVKPASDDADLLVMDEPIDTDGLRVERRYEITRKSSIGSSVVLSNTTNKPISRVWFEVVPKELADSVSDVEFSDRPDEVVLDDPVVYWAVELPPGTSRTIAWSTPLPTGAPADATYLNRAIALHRIAVKANRQVINRALKRLEDQPGIGKPVDPDDTIKGGGNPSGDPDCCYSDPGSTDPYGGGGPPPVYPPPNNPPPNNPPPNDPPTYDPPPKDPPPNNPPPNNPPPNDPPPNNPPPNNPPTISVSNRQSSELQSVSFAIGVSDRDGDRVAVSMSGLPPGIGHSGPAVRGTIRYDAASVTVDRRQGIRSRSFTVTVVASDGRGGRSTKTFSWQVADTYRLMPNYIGKYGCDGDTGCNESVPNISAISAADNRCAYDPNGNSDRIFRQGVAPNSVIRWGQPITYWYGSNNSNCDRVGKGW